MEKQVIDFIKSLIIAGTVALALYLSYRIATAGLL